MNHSAVLDANEVESQTGTDRDRSARMDRLLDTLANPRRRRVVRRLSERDAPIAFERLVEDVAAEERDRVDEDDCDGVRIALHHSHLPKLADAGVIVVNHDAETVEPGPQLPTVVDCLNAIEWSLEAAR